MVWLSLLAGTAFAGEQWVEIPFEEPATLPLFLKASIVKSKGKVEADDCPGAVQAALDHAEQGGQIVRVLVSKKDLKRAAQAVCKQRKAGQEFSASVVRLTSVVVVPGAPESVYPLITPDRAIEIGGLLGAITGGESISSAPIDDISGRAWVRLGSERLPDRLDQTQLDENARAVRAYEELVPAWAARWATVLTSVPEVHGAAIEVEVNSIDPDRGRKNRLTELYRFAVPTDAAAGFVRGHFDDEAFLARVAVERAQDAKKRDFRAYRLDVLAGSMVVEGEHGRVEREAVELPEEDLIGVDDVVEAPPEESPSDEAAPAQQVPVLDDEIDLLDDDVDLLDDDIDLLDEETAPEKIALPE